MKKSRYSLRSYRPGDEVALAGLCNAVNAGLAGFIPRTPEHWAWCYLQRPGLSADGVLLVEAGGEVSGHAVTSPSGEVLEFCLSAAADRRLAFQVLVEGVERYARENGADRISISAPPSDRELRAWFSELGYNQWLRYLTGLPLDLPGIIGLLLQARGAPSQLGGRSFLIHLAKKGRRFRSPLLGEETLLLVEGAAARIVDMAAGVDVIIRTDVFTFMRIMLREQPILRSVLRGEVSVEPIWRVPQARRLLSLLTVPYDLHVPVGDMV